MSTEEDLEFEPHDGWAWLDDVPAWGISLLIHGALGLALMSISWVIVSETRVELTSEVTAETDPVPVEYAIDTEVSQEAGNKSLMQLDGASLATAQHRGLETHPEEVVELEQETDPTLAVATMLPVPSEAELLEDISLMGTTEHAGGTAGAIDRITWEIAASLRQRRTIVGWLFDESLSLKKRRDQVAGRFDAIYHQLGQMNVRADENLTTGIIGFGEDLHVLQNPPSADVMELTRTVRTIENDVSGSEFVFAAVDRALRAYTRKKREQQANLMLIIVTDERGDDYSQLEKLIRRCTRSGTRVYCIGNSAVFGKQKGSVFYEWEANGNQFSDFIEVDQGPETAMVEGLQLPFWSRQYQRLYRMSAGFGPYALSRLCAETGGIYFVADDTSGQKFDPSVMRQYSPDYRPQKDYMAQLEKNKAKAALVKAAASAVPPEAVPQPQRRFRALNDTELRRNITEAQKPLATLDYYLQELHRVLESGESDRDKLDTNRWRASYDLAMGRVLAMRVRAFGYNMMLAQMKSSPRPFSKQGSNLWILNPSKTSDAGAVVKRMHDRAMAYLNRVIDEHPETPWALLASAELEEPLGWEWSEGSVPVPRENQQRRNRPQFAAEEQRRQQIQRQRSELKAASRPRL